MVSGGVDSTVCAALLQQALGAERVIAVHIDNGFMRHEESKSVEMALNALGLNVHCELNIDYILYQ
jgi:GMP synthase (glutamine-hydrolysing)